MKNLFFFFRLLGGASRDNHCLLSVVQCLFSFHVLNFLWQSLWQKSWERSCTCLLGLRKSVCECQRGLRVNGCFLQPALHLKSECLYSFPLTASCFCSSALPYMRITPDTSAKLIGVTYCSSLCVCAFSLLSLDKFVVLCCITMCVNLMLISHNWIYCDVGFSCK